MVPKILLFHTLLWPNAARLALAFRAAECGVYLLCRRTHPAYELSAPEAVCPYNPFTPLRSLRLAIEGVEPDFIIPCDDLAAAIMCELYSRLQLRGIEGRLGAILEQSLGKPEGYELAAARGMLATLVEGSGVVVPRTSPISSFQELRDWLSQEGYPAVLKTDGSWGGAGVAIVNTFAEARRAYLRMTGPEAVTRALKRSAWNQEPDPLLRLLRGLRPKLSVQKYVRGVPANSAVACWGGETLASIEAEALVTTGPTGNATVIRVLNNPGMVGAAQELVKRLGVSGFFGLDFVLEEGSGRPCLIEVNPRATQTNHLGLGRGRDLVGALRSRISGEPARDIPSVTGRETVALFPQELLRDPGSSFIKTAHHDVPYEWPELIQRFADMGLIHSRGSGTTSWPFRRLAW